MEGGTLTYSGLDWSQASTSLGATLPFSVPNGHSEWQKDQSIVQPRSPEGGPHASLGCFAKPVRLWYGSPGGAITPPRSGPVGLPSRRPIRWTVGRAWLRPKQC